MASKKEIRKYVFAKRKEVTQEEADRLSMSIFEKVVSLPEFKEATCVYAYVDYNKEASTREIIRKAWEPVNQKEPGAAPLSIAILI